MRTIRQPVLAQDDPLIDQPVKAAGLVVAGLGLSTASGLNTWLIRNIFGARHVTIGTEHIQPWLLRLGCYLCIRSLGRVGGSGRAGSKERRPEFVTMPPRDQLRWQQSHLSPSI